MKIEGIIWLNYVIDKLAFKHQVEIYEVEEVFAGKPKFRFVEKGERKGENVYMTLGQTEAGRYLTVLFIYKLKRRLFERQKYDKKKNIWQKIIESNYPNLIRLMN